MKPTAQTCDQSCSAESGKSWTPSAQHRLAWQTHRAEPLEGEGSSTAHLKQHKRHQRFKKFSISSLMISNLFILLDEMSLFLVPFCTLKHTRQINNTWTQRREEQGLVSEKGRAVCPLLMDFNQNKIQPKSTLIHPNTSFLNKLRSSGGNQEGWGSCQGNAAPCVCSAYSHLLHLNRWLCPFAKGKFQPKSAWWIPALRMEKATLKALDELALNHQRWRTLKLPWGLNSRGLHWEKQTCILIKNIFVSDTGLTI